MFEPVEHLRDRAGAADRAIGHRNQRVGRDLVRIAVGLGEALREERRRRNLTLRDVATMTGLGLGTVHAAESGTVCSLETYTRLADALRLRAEFGLVDPRRREPLGRRATDPLHAEMGEAEAAHLRGHGFEVGLDEPFQIPQQTRILNNRFLPPASGTSNPIGRMSRRLP